MRHVDFHAVFSAFSGGVMSGGSWICCTGLFFAVLSIKPASAEDALATSQSPAAAARADDKLVAPPPKVDVQPQAHDSQIQERLEKILSATGWFEETHIEVRDGVVFLSGVTRNDKFKQWAADLARNTQDVATVVNRIQVRESALWDFTPAKSEVQTQWTRIIASIPYLMIGATILLFAWWVSTLTTKFTLKAVETRIQAPLLRSVVAKTVGAIVLLLGFYIVLHVSGLSHLAVTMIGGTGLLGLIVGIAFKDITENFLASIFLSVQRPFQTGDLVTIADETGYVQSLTTRTTIIMTLDGNLVQIPNSTVYKSTIRNFTSNPNCRQSFAVGIGYKEDISSVQTIALQVLKEHPAVLRVPEPWVLVDNLGSATVNLQVYFWVDSRDHSWLTVKSSIIRMIKHALDERGISMPFETRSILPPRTISDLQTNNRNIDGKKMGPTSAVTKAEGGLKSEAMTIQNQADQSRLPDLGNDLLQAAAVGQAAQ